MPQQLRDRDPLIEACLFAEAKDARLPGFGRDLYEFILPLFRGASPDKLRLVQAACLLHDVSWRAHPDYRAEACFDYATRANLGGLKHWERLFVGLALLHRYKNKRANTRFGDLFDILNEKLMREAEILGKAMRFGAMLSMSESGRIGEMDWRPKKKVLKLCLLDGTWPLFGEVAQARLQSLAQALNGSVVVKRK